MRFQVRLLPLTAAFGATLSLNLAPASADTFNFSYSADSNVIASGVLTTDPFNPTSQSYQITSITGTRNGNSIDGLLAPNQFLANDNLLLAGSPQLDAQGFAYTSGGSNYNVFYTSGYLESESVSNTTTPITFSATPSVPEPSEILAVIGVGALIGAQRLKRMSASVTLSRL